MNQMTDDAWVLFADWRTQLELGESADDLQAELLKTALTGITHLSHVADLSLAQSKFTIAETRLQEALLLAPENPWLLFQLGHAMLGRGKKSDARETFHRALVLHEFDPIRAIVTQLDVAELATEAARQTVIDQIAAADALFDTGNLDAADDILKLADDSDLFPVVTKVKRANIAILLGRLDDATLFLDAAQKRDGNNEWVLYNRALIAEVHNDLKAACAFMDSALQKAPTNDHFGRTRARMIRAAELQAAKQVTFNYQTGNRGSSGDAKADLKVICWDLSHNPAGRAAVLAEVAETFSTPRLVGPVFLRNGAGVWPPLADSDKTYDVVSWTIGDFRCFVEGAIEYVRDNPCGRVWVSKARFPSLFIGCLYKLIHDAVMVVDLDDDELAFVDQTGAMDFAEFAAAEAKVN